jgi:8-oxo-dGTP pyrophosphatase MutT (NUDIX family)
VDDEDRPLYLQMDDRTAAAVALTLRAGPEPEILLIRRAEAEGDPWSGHMALPGGRKEQDDDDLLQTAMRETLEETGLDLAARGQPLGRMDELAPNTWRLPPISIHPFVFGVAEGAVARVASHEIVETLWVPISTFQDPACASTVEVPVGRDTRSFPCFRVDERVVWGLTYRILTRFLSMAPELPPTRR